MYSVWKKEPNEGKLERIFNFDDKISKFRAFNGSLYFVIPSKNELIICDSHSEKIMNTIPLDFSKFGKIADLRPFIQGEDTFIAVLFEQGDLLIFNNDQIISKLKINLVQDDQHRKTLCKTLKISPDGRFLLVHIVSQGGMVDGIFAKKFSILEFNPDNGDFKVAQELNVRGDKFWPYYATEFLGYLEGKFLVFCSLSCMYADCHFLCYYYDLESGRLEEIKKLRQKFGCQYPTILQRIGNKRMISVGSDGRIVELKFKN